MTDFSKNPVLYRNTEQDYNFNEPLEVPITGNSPPMSGIDADDFNGTTYVPFRNEIQEGRAVPLERAIPKRKKAIKGASNESLRRGREAFLAGLGVRPSGQVRKDKNLV